MQFLQCQRWPQVRRALPITDAAPRRVPPVSGWDGARSLARAHCVPAPRRRGTGPRQTPLGHRRRRGAVIIIIRSAARRLCCLFFSIPLFRFPGSRSIPSRLAWPRSCGVPTAAAVSGGDSGGGGDGDAAPPPRVRLAEK